MQTRLTLSTEPHNDKPVTEVEKYCQHSYGQIRFHAGLERHAELLDGVTGAIVKLKTQKSGDSLDLHTGTGYV